jgi:hypothetical protein
MTRPVRVFVRDFPWIHLGLGLVGNVAFFVGSIFFLWESTKLAGIWLFIVGAGGMMIGSLGQLFVWIEEHRERRARGEVGQARSG